MFAHAVPTLIRVFVMVAMTAAAPITAALMMNAGPTAALCKYGTPHCFNPDPGPKLPKPKSAQIPA